jgi:hypothetical protein
VLVHLRLASSVSFFSKARYLKRFILYFPFPPGFLFLVTIFSAFWSDRYESRGITTALISLLAVVGFALYLGKNRCYALDISEPNCCLNLGAEHKFTSYGALYLMVPGVYATAPVLSAWMANNSEPYYRRATSVAIGFIATNSVCFAFILLLLLLLFTLFVSGWHFEYLEFPL